MSEGSIYIMHNPAYRENLFKIGRTKRNAQQRANELFTTGVPAQFIVCYEKDVPNCVLAEDLIHEKLKKYRPNAKREFFGLSLQEAISAVEEVIYEEFYKDAPSLHPGIHKLDENTTFRWTCYSKGIILLFRYRNWLDDKPTVEIFWGCKAKDHVLLTTKLENDSSNLVKLANDAHIPGSLSDVIDICPGDRIAVIGSPKPISNSQQLSLLEPELSIISIVDCWEYAKMLAFMENIEINSEGFPISFGDRFDDEPPAIAREALHRVLEMGSPDIYHNPKHIR